MKVCEGWKTFLNELEETELPLVCFGAGTLPWLIEPLFTRLSIWDRILFFLDNDEKKSGTWIGEGKKIPVITVNRFKEINQKKFLMLITCEAFATVIEQLQRIEEWRNIHCYLYIFLNSELVKNVKQPLSMICEGPPLIPKVIHYCWFGFGEKEEAYQRCIQGWKDKCPDYEIIEWNESNYDIHQSRYMEEAYANQKWAYVSDYARLDILYRFGGIYLDADVELLDRPDMLLSEKGFIAYGQWPAVNSGAGMGCVKGLPIVREMRDEPRKEITFLKPGGGYNMLQNGFYESKVLRKYGFASDFSMQYLDDMLILAPEIIATDSILGEKTFVTENTLALHHCRGSWASCGLIDERRQTARVCQEVGK